MTKEEVNRLYQIWKFHRSYNDCQCEDHAPERKKVCNRENSWRAYVKARDEYLGPFKEKKKIIDIDSILDSFSDMDD